MTTHSHRSPTWQADACPAWCVVQHDEDDALEDRCHESAADPVPSIAPGGEPIELLVALSRRHGDPMDWVFVGEARRSGQYLHLSRESAIRVARAMLALAHAASSGDDPDDTDKSVDP